MVCSIPANAAFAGVSWALNSYHPYPYDMTHHPLSIIDFATQPSSPASSSSGGDRTLHVFSKRNPLGESRTLRAILSQFFRNSFAIISQGFSDRTNSYHFSSLHTKPHPRVNLKRFSDPVGKLGSLALGTAFLNQS